jgi:pyruvate,water dikinase
VQRTTDQCSAWRVQMAERIGLALDPERFGVEALYLIGSSKNATAGPASDIDLLVLFAGTSAQRDALLAWLEGWSLCLDEINFAETGYRTGGLLDVHLLTAADVAARTSYAVRIDAPTDRARRLPLKPPGP